MTERDPGHGEVLRAIGNLEGKLDAIHQAMSLNRSDITEAFRRLNQAEQRIAQGVVLAVFLSFVMPLVVTMAGPRLHFNEPPRSHHGVHHREHA